MQCHFVYLLRHSFQTGSRNIRSYFLVFFLIALLEEVFVRNIIILLRISYKV
jgi:hypothetical protein